MEISKDRLLSVIVDAFGRRFAIREIDTTDVDAIRFNLDGHRLRVSVRGNVESDLGGVLASDMQAKLVEMIAIPLIVAAHNAK